MLPVGESLAHKEHGLLFCLLCSSCISTFFLCISDLDLGDKSFFVANLVIAPSVSRRRIVLYCLRRTACSLKLENVVERPARSF